MRAIRSITRITMLLCMVWLFMSWVEVACKNTQIEPQYNDYNAFVLLTKQGKGKAESEEAHAEIAVVVSITDGEIEVRTTDGNIWGVLVDNGSEYRLNQTIGVEFTGYGKDARITDLIEVDEANSSASFCHVIATAIKMGGSALVAQSRVLSVYKLHKFQSQNSI